MIKNRQQLKLARQRLLSLQHQLKPPSGNAVKGDDVGRQLSEEAAQLSKDIKHFELLAGSRNLLLDVSDLRGLPDLLIAARIARGMTQKELAEFLGFKMQQIQFYESERYQSTTIARVARVADALGLRIAQSGELQGAREMTPVDPSLVSAFPFAEMWRRGWFDFLGGHKSEGAPADLLTMFFEGSLATEPAARRYARTVGPPHQAAISAWETRVVKRAEARVPMTEFDPSLITPEWLRGLTGLGRSPAGKARIRGYFEAAGIVLLAEPSLPGAGIDSAAIRTPKGAVAIALSFREEREEVFWLALLQALVHAVRHVGNGMWDAIFIERGTGAASDWEEEADVIARQWLLPDSSWSACKSVLGRTEESIKEDARRLRVAPAIVAARLLREVGEGGMPKIAERRSNTRKAVFGE